MEIKYIGDPENVESDDKDLQVLLRRKIQELGNEITVVETDNLKTAKMLLLLLNWERVKSNEVVHNNMSQSPGQQALQKVFKDVSFKQMNSLPSKLAFHRSNLDQFVSKFSQEDITSILKQESNINVDIFDVLPTEDGSYRSEKLQVINPPQPFNKSWIFSYTDSQIRKILVCISVEPEIRQFSVPRGNTDSQNPLNAYAVIRGIVNKEGQKAQSVSRILKFAIYLIILVPISALCIYFLYHSSNNLYMKRLDGYYGENELRTLYEYTWNPIGSSSLNNVSTEPPKLNSTSKVGIKSDNTAKKLKKSKKPKNKIPKQKSKNPLLNKKKHRKGKK